MGAAAPGVDPKSPSQKSYDALTALGNGAFTIGRGGETWLIPFATSAPVLEGHLRCGACLPPQ